MGSRFLLASCLLAMLALAAGQHYTKARQFRINAQPAEESDESDLVPSAATLQQFRARQAAQQPSYEYSSSSEEEEENVPTYTRAPPPQQQPKQYVNTHQPQQQTRQQPQTQQKLTRKQQKQIEEELEEEEPDRLAVLLESSKFVCNDRANGYYADDTIGCEVFHYCSENSKHSWVCPEGFTFHQVHLICMPPSNENVCDQSAKYTFVNDYLYKPINMEEHQSKPNVTLRYSERFYPENVFTDDRQEYEGERVQTRHHAKTPVRNQPIQYSQPSRTQQPQQNVYRSPDEINISLQQRRPYFAATTPRYEEEEYSYERK